jgi:RNA polymerase sigma factor (TIGR02999 family)
MAAAEAMRRILVENARQKKTLKRGGHRQRVGLDQSMIPAVQKGLPEDLLMLNDALDKLSAHDRVAADLIKLRVFSGLSAKEAARILEVSTSKASRDLEYACAWLRIEMGESNMVGQ